MQSYIFLLVAAAINVHGQRPNSTSVCDFYSNALFGASNATTQSTLLTAVVNTVVIGNYTMPNKNAVPGILASNATYNGTKVNLARYFDGSLKSTNTGGLEGVSVNFLDGGGAEPLTQNKPANGKGSHQYKLISHLYSFFGTLLGCSDIGQPGLPSYKGDTSMFEVHKFMALDAYEVQYFIQQVGLAAASFGVSTEDVEAVGKALQDLFGYKCAPKTTVDSVSEPELQSICIAENCPEAPNADCNAYRTVSEPSTSSGKPATHSSMTNTTTTGSATLLSISIPALICLAGISAIVPLA